MAQTLDERIDDLYAGPLDRFTAERDALAKELRTAGDDDGARTVKALRKPVVSAWALNVLAREDPEAIGELLAVGERLRAAHRRAVSGGEAEAFRQAAEERRHVVDSVARRVVTIVERGDGGGTAQQDAIAGTLAAATVDEETAELLRRGRLVKPAKPPSTFADAGLRLLEGGRRAAAEREVEPRPPAPEPAKLRRELSAAESRERRAAQAVERERERIADLERKRSEARERLRAAEAEHRGASLERKRLASTIAKLEDRRR